jgi:dihydropteroate synthase
MDSLAAAPGTGPATSPLPILRKPRPLARFEDLPSDRTLVMGIVNVTPDSFSDGGQHASADSAIAAGLRMFYAGADIIDVGGESTRPGAEDVSPEEEQQRVIPVIEALVKAGALVSIDTIHTATAAAALRAGAAIINDVSGLTMEPEMAELVASSKAPYVLTHRRGDARTMNSLAEYKDVAGEVVAELAGVRDKLYAAGVSPEQIIVDPGLGFAKNDAQNWELLQNLDQPGPPGPGGCLAQAVPRYPADSGRQVCRAPGTGCRHCCDHCDQRFPGCLGRARARRRRQPGRR